MKWNKYLFIYFCNKLVTNKLKFYIDHDNINSCESDGVRHSSGGGISGGDSDGICSGDRNDSRIAVVDCWRLSDGSKVVLWLR